MSQDFCLIHGNVLEYDYRSGFNLCKACESGCTCGPDYQDRFCPRHGDQEPSDKWKVNDL